MNGSTTTYAAGTLNYNSVAFNDDIAGPGNNETLTVSGAAAQATTVSDMVGILTPPKQPASGSDMDMVILWASNGDYAVTQFNPSCSGGFGVRIETGHPTLHSGCINVLPQTDYYFAMSSNFTSGLATLYVYNTDGTLFGNASVVSVSHPGSTFQKVTIGNNEGGFEPGTTYFQNLMLNWTNASSGPLFWTQTSSTPAVPVITSAGSANGTVGTAFSYQITGTNSPTSFNATGLPGGLSVSTSTGLISGTPTASGSSTVTISATNAGGTRGQQACLSASQQFPPLRPRPLRV